MAPPTSDNVLIDPPKWWQLRKRLHLKRSMRTATIALPEFELASEDKEGKG